MANSSLDDDLSLSADCYRTPTKDNIMRDYGAWQQLAPLLSQRRVRLSTHPVRRGIIWASDTARFPGLPPAIHPDLLRTQYEQRFLPRVAHGLERQSIVAPSELESTQSKDSMISGYGALQHLAPLLSLRSSPLIQW